MDNQAMTDRHPAFLCSARPNLEAGLHCGRRAIRVLGTVWSTSPPGTNSLPEWDGLLYVVAPIR